MNQEEKRETVGASSLKLSLKQPETRNPFEQMCENYTDYEKNVQECIATNLNKYEGNFYVVVLTKKERTMTNVIRNYFLARQTCPTPEYDQVVYRYNRLSGGLEFIWVLPAKDVCEHLLINRLEVAPGEMALLQFVLQLEDGTLLRRAKELAGEKRDSNILGK